MAEKLGIFATLNGIILRASRRLVPWDARQPAILSSYVDSQQDQDWILGRFPATLTSPTADLSRQYCRMLLRPPRESCPGRPDAPSGQPYSPPRMELRNCSDENLATRSLSRKKPI